MNKFPLCCGQSIVSSCIMLCAAFCAASQAYIIWLCQKSCSGLKFELISLLENLAYGRRKSGLQVSGVGVTGCELLCHFGVVCMHGHGLPRPGLQHPSPDSTDCCLGAEELRHLSNTSQPSLDELADIVKHLTTRQHEVYRYIITCLDGMSSH